MLIQPFLENHRETHQMFNWISGKFQKFWPNLATFVAPLGDLVSQFAHYWKGRSCSKNAEKLLQNQPKNSKNIALRMSAPYPIRPKHDRQTKRTPNFYVSHSPTADRHQTLHVYKYVWLSMLFLHSQTCSDRTSSFVTRRIQEFRGNLAVAVLAHKSIIYLLNSTYFETLIQKRLVGFVGKYCNGRISVKFLNLLSDEATGHKWCKFH